MSLIKFNPVTSSQRHYVGVNKKHLWDKSPLKSLTSKKNAGVGRNNLGRITVYGRSGGAKKVYRNIDFKRRNNIGNGLVERIEYDPNRTAFIALIKYEDSYSYILAPNGLKIGDQVSYGKNSPIAIGNCLLVQDIPIGTSVHNVELKPGKGGQLARSAGNSAIITSKEGSVVTVKMSSGEVRIINNQCLATIGIVSNLDNKNIKIGKAGRNRWLGRRPKVRGVAMNPVDHPHGGGEGRTSGGRHPVNFKGNLTKGLRTRKNRMTGKFIVKSRHNKK